MTNKMSHKMTVFYLNTQTINKIVSNQFMEILMNFHKVNLFKELHFPLLVQS